MSDYSDFCKMYGGSANDPDVMDNWLSEHANGEEFTNNTIKCVTVLLNSQHHDYYNEWMNKNNYRFEDWVYDNLTYNDSVEHNNYIKITPPHIIHIVT